MSLILKLAFRNIFRQRRRSLLTALSIGGGYLLCTLSFSLLEGSYNNLIELFTLTRTGHVQIHLDDYLDRAKIHKAINNYEGIGSKLSQLKDVKSYSYRVYAPALAYSDTGNQPAKVIGIDLAREARTTLISDKVTSGRYISSYPDNEGYFSAMIGIGIAESLKIGLGDELILISQGADGSVANDIFKVGAIIGSRDISEKTNVYLPLGAAQTFLALNNQIHEVVITLSRFQQAEAFSTELQSLLPNLTVSPWQKVEADFYKSMQSDKQGNRVTLGIILFIVFIGVLNTVLMSVLERTREFGVLKALGSRPATIFCLITLETTLLALMTVVVAFFVSLPIMYWLSNVGFSLSEPIDVGGIAFSAFRGEVSVFVFAMPLCLLLGFALLVSIPPGLRAARIKPTQAMSSH